MGSSRVGDVTLREENRRALRRRRPPRLFIGYLVGAGIMILGGIVGLVFGISAEGKSLEDITKPLTATDAEPTVDAAPATTPA